jgi:hypothetical protein
MVMMMIMNANVKITCNFILSLHRTEIVAPMNKDRYLPEIEMSEGVSRNVVLKNE